MGNRIRLIQESDLSVKADATAVETLEIESHNHPNKNILNGVEESFTTDLKSYYDNSAQLDGTGKLKSEQIPESLLAGLDWKGVLDVSVDTIEDADVAGSGAFHKVSIGAETPPYTSSITGTAIDYKNGDWLISNGTTWGHIPTTENNATDVAVGVVQLTNDFGGTATEPKVAGIQGIPVSETTPTDGQKMVYDAETEEIIWKDEEEDTSSILPMTTFERDNMSDPQEDQLIYNKDRGETECYVGGEWIGSNNDEVVVGTGPMSAKSIVLDVADNWGGTTYTVIRSILFYKDGILVPVAQSDFSAYATSTYPSYIPAWVFDSSLSLTGTLSGTSWESNISEASNNRISAVFNTPIEFDEIRIHNGHNYGMLSDRGIKNTVIYLSSLSEASDVYQATLADTEAITIFDGEVTQHAESDVEDYMPIVNLTQEVETTIPSEQGVSVWTETERDAASASTNKVIINSDTNKVERKTDTGWVPTETKVHSFSPVAIATIKFNGGSIVTYGLSGFAAVFVEDATADYYYIATSKSGEAYRTFQEYDEVYAVLSGGESDNLINLSNDNAVGNHATYGYLYKLSSVDNSFFTSDPMGADFDNFTSYITFYGIKSN